MVYLGESDWDGPLSLEDMMDVPDKFKKFVNNHSLHLLKVRDAAEYQFKNQDNHDFFTMIQEFYSNNGKMDLNVFREKYPDFEIYWETLAAIGAATGTTELIEYAYHNKGGRLRMCTALENLKQEGILEGRQEGILEAIQEMVEVLHELDIDDETIIKKLKEKFHITEDKARSLLD